MKVTLRTLNKLNKKKSAGVDGLSQEQLIMGANSISIPLTKIINTSIEEGKFPENWKEALITPVLIIDYIYHCNY